MFIQCAVRESSSLANIVIYIFIPFLLYNLHLECQLISINGKQTDDYSKVN